MITQKRPQDAIRDFSLANTAKQTAGHVDGDKIIVIDSSSQLISVLYRI